jgi:hypothetical protein
LEEHYDELLNLEADTDVLFIVGDADPQAPEQQLKALRQNMQARTWRVKVLKGDHAFTLGGVGGDQQAATCNIMGQLAVRWNMSDNRDPALSELTLSWNDQTNQCDWTAWSAPVTEPARPNTRLTIGVAGPHIRRGGGSFNYSLPQ